MIGGGIQTERRANAREQNKIKERGEEQSARIEQRGRGRR